MNAASITRLVDRPGLRWPAALAASVAESAARRQVVRVSPRPGTGYVHRHRDGVLVLADVLTRVSPARFEHDVLDLFCHAYMPKPGDVIVDIGAGCGEEALTLSRLIGPSGRMISVEAQPSTFRRLELTCRYNGLTNVTPVQLAIADTETTVRIDDGAVGGSGGVAASIGRGGTIEVRAVTIDQLIADHALDRVDLLKMNIEGAEQLAVKGMSESASKIRNVAISCHDFVLQPGFPGGDPEWFATYDKVSAVLRDAGFVLAPRRTGGDPWVPYFVYGSRG